jgi:thermitase
MAGACLLAGMLLTLALDGSAAAPLDAPDTVDPSAADVQPERGVAQPRNGMLPSQEAIQSVQLSDGREVLPDHVLVGFRQRAGPTASVATRRRLGSAFAGREPIVVRSLGSRMEVHGLPGGVSVDDALREYRTDPDVAFAEPDVLRPVQSVPDDPINAYQWNLAAVHAPEGWSVTHGRPSVRVAMVDSGIFDRTSSYLAPDGKPGHPDLRDKVDLDYDATTTDPTQQDPDDWIGHGTHTAGIAAAATNNALGVAGVGYDTHLLNAKGCKSGRCADSWVVDAINWSVANGAKVISLTGASPTTCPATLQAAIDNAWDQNIVVVAPAGNSSSSEVMTPGDCNHVLSVASTNADDSRSSFSEYGTWVSVAAPGGQDAAGDLILSTGYTGLYEYREGTSMAAPLVSGLAALLWTTPYGTSASAVVQRIMSTADRITGTGTLWKAGRVNVAAALGASSILAPIATPITQQIPIPPGWTRPPGLEWNSRSPMPTPRSRVGVGALGVTIYVVGGANAQRQAVNTVEAYDSVRDGWQARGPLPTRNAAAGVASAPNGLLYAAGGTPDGFEALDTLQVYDPSANAWTSAAPMPTPRWGLALQLAADGKLYAIGGRNSSAVLSTVEAYDPATNTWSARATMQTPRAFAASVLGPTNKRVYVAGGADASYRPVDAFEVYDPATNSWVSRPGLPMPLGSLGLAAVPNGHIFAAGGDSSASVADVYEYNPFTRSWSAAVAMPRARGGGFGLITMPNGTIYAVGGWTNGTPLAPIDAAALIAPKT